MVDCKCGCATSGQGFEDEHGEPVCANCYLRMINQTQEYEEADPEDFVLDSNGCLTG